MKDTLGFDPRPSAKMITTLIVAASLVSGCALIPNSNPKSEQRAEVRDMASQTLRQLYGMHPSARSAVSSAAGYAVFSNFGMKILVAGGGSGEGLAVVNRTRHETFMKMVEVQAGLGMGIKQFRQVWVFEREADIDRFVNSGWELGGQTTAAAKVAGAGASLEGALSVSPGVWVYQITESGLALELTAKGTKYFKDKNLN